ncbi:BON domain-containing protein [Actinoplanes sp. NPDC024001]|uniref:BON domain-containing protein n=1 Tax=Actinoplanes sp. NPDC024001 TaxID=3154598 RepID=UPI0033F80D5C
MWPFDDDPRFDRRARPATSPDVRLTCDVIERILGDPRLAGERITVEVQNRVVNLLGTVNSLYARVVAAELARSTPGVLDICNRLQLASMERPRPDTFDELVAGWGDVATARSVRPGVLGTSAALVTLAAGLLWLVVLRRFGAA